MGFKIYSRLDKIHHYKAIFLLFCCVLISSACSLDSTSTESETSPPDTTENSGFHSHIAIESAGTFNFSDPFPVRPWLQSGDYKYFYSTRPSIMYTNGPITSYSFVKEAPIRINNGVLKQYINNNGVTVHGYWGKNVYQDSSGTWHMVASPRLKRNGRFWTIITHLKPQKGEVWSPGAPIQNWVIDKILVGDPLATKPTYNYAAKYYKGTDGKLYLIYNQRVSNSANKIFAQRMKSFLTINEDYDPQVLLQPESFNSEFRNGTSGIKLIEAANIVEANGKYIITYSVGDFAADNYKIGLAWSDNLLGPYKKVHKIDESNIWGNGTGEPEVRYLLQTQKPQWPNYVKDQVKAPGVGSINKDSDGKWYLFFAGYQPFATKQESGKYNASNRYPFFVRIKMNIPNKSIANTTNQELQDWIKLHMRDE